MNPITFNDCLFNPQLIASKINLPLSVFTSPIFVDVDPEEAELESGVCEGVQRPLLELYRGIISNPNLFPFREMRLELKANALDRANDCPSFRYWVSHQDGAIKVIAMPMYNNLVHRWALITKSEGMANEDSMMFEYFVCAGGKVGGIDELAESGKARARAAAQGFFTSLAHFVWRYNSGINFIAAVHPNKQGKSVAWTTARTHYVLIHKSHPANAETVKTGSAVTEDAGYIKRQAHSRRAHFRVLRSPKFKNKVGQKIRVKACWVGPKEWKQGSSIYVLKAQP